MRKRLVCTLAILVMALAAFPLGASAASPNVARVSATSWQDMLGREFNSLCSSGGAGIGTAAPGPAVQTTVRFSGKGSEMAGNGTGSLTLSFYGSYFDMYGTLTVNGEEKSLQGGGQMFCIMGDLAIVYGSFFYSDYVEITTAIPADGVYGSLTGTISDGVHPGQGSLSLTLMESDGPPA